MDYRLTACVLQPSPAASTPLALIGGFHPRNTPPPQEYSRSEVTSLAVWDWYQASFEADPETVVSVICSELNCVPEPCKPQPPYLYGMAFHPLDVHNGKVDTKHTLLTLYYGGINTKVLVRATSDEAEYMAPFVRKHWPDHQVSRADMALDFDHSGAFDEFSDWLIEYARANRIKTAFAGDWANGTSGRTLYVGSRQSAVFIRLYEKGHERMSKGIDASPDWVRFEAEIKPQTKEAKQRLAKLEAHQCFGVSKVTRAFAEVIGGRYDAIKVTKGRAEKSSDPMRHLLNQYGEILKDYFQSELNDKDPAQVIADLVDRIDQQKQQQKNINVQLKAKAAFSRGIFWRQSSPSSFPLAPVKVQLFPTLSHGLKFQPVHKVFLQS